MANTDDYSDLIDLGIDISEEDDLTVKFNKCAKHVQSIAGNLDSNLLLQLYGYYKQSLEGACTTPRPNWYDLRGKSKWDAWKALGNLDRSEAKSKYIEIVLAASPDFSFEEAGKSKAASWVCVSAPVNQELPVERNICDYIRNGDILKVSKYFQENRGPENSLDSNGMGLIHYTADIGNAQILEMLLNEGYDPNFQDVDGQTALHYAASCGHSPCIKLLLSKGAKANIQDSEGNTAKDVASDNSVQELFS